MFRGEYQHSIDAKGRIILPSKFRDELGDIFIITRGMDYCLYVFTMEKWEDIEKKVPSVPMNDKNDRQFLRMFIGGATEGEPDAQGRVNLPTNLRTHADIKKDVVTIGVGNRIEIWSRERWDSYNQEFDFEDRGLADKITQLGI